MSTLSSFHFNKRERNGIFILTLILVGLIAYYFYMPYLVENESENPEIRKSVMLAIAKFDSLEAIEKQAKAEYSSNKFSKVQSKQSDKYDNQSRPYVSKRTIEIEQSLFNPNTSNQKELQRQGIPSWLAKRIENYTSKGGEFRTKSDIKKIYGFTDSLYLKIVHYIDLPDNLPVASKVEEKSNTKAKVEEKVFDLNSAKAEELVKLRGIGPAYSKRIIAYRDKLGGYVNKEQLMEVYGISDSLYYSLEHRVEVKEIEAMNQIDINTVGLGELSRHPYFTFTMAKSILEYRDRKGPFKNIDEIENKGLLNPYLYAKIKPYIRVPK